MDFSQFEISKDAVFVQFTYPRGPRKGELIFEQMPDPDNMGQGIDDPNAPCGAFMYGADSEQFRKHVRAQNQRNLDNQAKGRRAGTTSVTDVEKRIRETFLDCVSELVRVGWKGKMLRMPEDGITFYESLPDFVEQLDEAMADRGRFMPALSKN